ncbi:MAG: EamA family transporter [Candidatus Nanoarchaeia archaeon]
MESKSINKRKSIFFVFISTLLIAGAQFFLKKGANLASETLFSYVNLWIILGIIIYGFATFLFIISLKYGNLSTVYPFLGLGYIWVILISYFVFKELLTYLDILGIGLIILGLSVLGGVKNE